MVKNSKRNYLDRFTLNLFMLDNSDKNLADVNNFNELDLFTRI